MANHGIDATLTLGGNPLTGYIEDVSMSLRRELAEFRGLSAGSVVRVAGLQDFTFTSNMAWDATAYGYINTARVASSPTAVAFSPDGGTTTFTVSCFVPQCDISAASNDKAGLSIQLSSSGDCVVS